MVLIEAFLGIQQIASAKAQEAKQHVYKSGKNKGDIKFISAKPARAGLLPVSEKTIWNWVKQGKFPPPLKISGRTVWRSSDVQKWMAEQSEKVTHG